MNTCKIAIIFLLFAALFATGTALAQSSFVINPGLGDELKPMKGLDGGQSRRPVGAVLAPNGLQTTFITNEIILNPASNDELRRFLSRYGGVVIRDGKARLIEGETPRDGLSEKSGWYLVRVNVRQSPLDDLSENLTAADLGGEWGFSSEEAARLIALALRERHTQISPNFVIQPNQACQVCEHPDGSGGNLDAATWWWMTEDDDPAVPNDQGLSIGVVRAWEYLKYQGYPREGVPYVPVKIAVLDSGFDLDINTGKPLNGNQDFFFAPPRPLQIDEVDGDWRVGGEHGHGWHGQSVFGICCAFSRNSWGTAGIANGSEIKTLLIRVDGDYWTLASGVYDALYNNAHVINMSWGGSCGSLCHTFDNGNVLKAYVGSARNVGSIVVSSAGNDGNDISGDDIYPCELSGSICVGAIGQNGNAYTNPNWWSSNWGNPVDIWAPTLTRSTVTRDSAATDGDGVGIDELDHFPGTSASAPFVSGVVAMMKMLNKNLYWSQVEQILANTANTSNDPKVSAGYIDAFAAVEAAKHNKPPVVKITGPTPGSTVGLTNIWFGGHCNRS